MKAPPLNVEVVGPPTSPLGSGIGRTFRNLLNPGVDADSVILSPAQQRGIPLSDRLTPLRMLPLSVRGHRRGAIVHFAQIVGCAQLLWNPVHPSVVTVHDLGVHVCSEDAKMFSRAERALLDLQFRGMTRADAFVCVSHTTARSLNAVFGISETRIRTVYHSVDTGLFRALGGSREQLAKHFGIAFEPQVHTLLYVGNELPRKNLSMLFEAMVELRARGVRVRLLKVGGPGGPRWREKTLDAAAKYGLRVGIDLVLVGYVEDDALPFFYNAADAFITPSLLEGFGLPVVEAMACGTPVACSNAGALPEVAEGSTALFDPSDPKAMADAIAEIIQNSEHRNRLVERGLDRVAAINRAAGMRVLLDLYEDLAQATPEKRGALRSDL